MRLVFENISIFKVHASEIRNLGRGKNVWKTITFC